MKAVIVVTGSAVIVAVVLFIGSILAALLGAFAGWVVQSTPLAYFVIAGAKLFSIEVSPDQLPALGAVLGFAGHFFRSTASHSKD